MVPLSQELEVLDRFSSLVNRLPYRSIEVKGDAEDGCFLVPGVLLVLVEKIIRTTIARRDQKLSIIISQDDNNIMIIYPPHDRLRSEFTL